MASAVETRLSDVYAEQAVLATVLFDPPTFGQLRRVVSEADFSESRHRDLWHIMHGLWEQRIPADVVLVGRGMREMGLERFAPDYEVYLAELVRDPVYTAYGLHYADVVAGLAEKRRFVEAMSAGATAAIRPDVDPDALLAQVSAAVMSTRRTQTRGEYVHLGTVADDIFGAPQRRVRMAGVFAALGKTLGGFRPGELIVFGARPGTGKTASMVQLLWDAAEHQGFPVGMVSLEMPSRSLRTRLMGYLAGVDTSEQYRDQHAYSDAENDRLRDASQRIDVTPIFVDDHPIRTISSVANRIRAMVEEQRVSVVGVDYIQLLVDNLKGENRAQELSRISGGLKQLAMELNIPIICLAQINRAVEGRADPAPRLSDLKDSGSIEQDADIVVLMHEDEAMVNRLKNFTKDGDTLLPIPTPLIQFNVAKNRNGPKGKLLLHYSGEHVAFRELPAAIIQRIKTIQERAA